MASPALTLAAQTNGRKSRGPVTPEGKRKSAADHLHFRDVFTAEYHPANPYEDSLVEIIALAEARTRWVWRAQAAYFNARLEASPDPSANPLSQMFRALRNDPSREYDLLNILENRLFRQSRAARRALEDAPENRKTVKRTESSNTPSGAPVVFSTAPAVRKEEPALSFPKHANRGNEPNTIMNLRMPPAHGPVGRPQSKQRWDRRFRLPETPHQTAAHKPRRVSRSRRGSALLTVLWLTAALAAISLAVANNVRGETERSATNVDDAKSCFIARGAVDRALLHMSWGQDYYRFGQPAMDFTFPGAIAHVDIVPETARLSANFSRPEEIVRLLIALGQPEDKAMETATAIVDWRTPQPVPGQSPFDAFYLSQNPSFLPRHASFLEDEELLQVRGITPDLYYGTSLDGSRAGLRDCLSAHASGGPVDIDTARAETMIAVGLAPEDAAAIVRNRATHPILDFRELAAIQQSLGPAGQHLRLGGNSMFTLRATARLRQPDGRLSDMKRTVAALVKRWDPNNKMNKDPGFEIVRWYDRT